MDLKRERDLSDEELQSVADEWLRDFPIEKLPTYLLYQLIFKSGLSVANMHRLCSINRRFHQICRNWQIWDKVFIDKFLARGKNLTDAEREKYLGTDKYKAWRKDSKRMPEQFVHLLAYSIVDSNTLSVSLDKQVGASALRITFFPRHDKDTYFATVQTLPDMRVYRYRFPDDFTACLEKYQCHHLRIPEASIVQICYDLLQSEWRPRDAALTSFLECDACGSPNIQFTCGKCNNFAFCSHACSDSIAKEHDALCHKADCKSQYYLSKHLSLELNDETIELTEQEASTLQRLHNALKINPTETELNEAHALIGARRRRRKKQRSKSRGKRRTGMSRSTSSNKPIGVKAKAKKAKSPRRARSPKRQAASAKRANSKTRRSASRENKQRSASKQRAQKSAARKSRSAERSKSRSASRSKSAEKKKEKSAQRANSKVRRTAAKDNKKRDASANRSKKTNARKSKSAEKKPSTRAQKPKRDASKSKKNKGKDSDSESKSPRHQRKGSLFSNRSKKTDNSDRSKNLSLTFGGGSGGGGGMPGGAGAPSLPSGGGGGGGGMPSGRGNGGTPQPPTTVIVIPQQQQQQAPPRSDSDSDSGSDFDLDSSSSDSEAPAKVSSKAWRY